MKNKTALQELLEYINSEKPQDFLSSKNTAEIIVDKIKELLPKEKEQITDAFKDQCDNLYKLEMSEKYYEQNFAQ